MKTTIIKKTTKHLLRSVLLVIGICFISATQAQYTANFTPTIGANGFVSFAGTSNLPIPAPGTGFRHFVWTLNGNYTMYSNSNDSNASYTYPGNGTYPVELTVEDSSSLGVFWASDSQNIVINNIPCSVSFTDSVGLNGYVIFNATSTMTGGGVPTYTWNFADGTTAVTQNSIITHTYPASYTVYGVSVTLNDSGSGGSCSAWASNWVTIYDTTSYNPCDLSANFTFTTGAGGLVNFTSTSTGVTPSTVFVWAPNANITYGNYVYQYGAGLNNYSYTYAYNGTYYAYLTLYDTLTGCADWTWGLITINNATPCNLTASFTDNVQSNGQVTYTSTSTGTGAGTVYEWDPGDGTGIQYGNNTFNYTYYYNGTYNVLLNISDSLGGCNSMDTMSVTINNADSCLYASYADSTGPVTYIGYDSITGQPDTITYTAYYFYSVSDTSCSDSTGRRAQRVLGGSKGPQIDYMWNFGDGSKVSGVGLSHPIHQYTKPGNYTTTLAIKYNGSVRQSRTTHTVTPLGIPTIVKAGSVLSLSPNPNTGQFRLSLGNISSDQTPEIDITNVLGEVVYKTTVAASGNRLTKDIDLQSAAPGMYFVKVITPTQVYTTKMVIGR